jgi:Xaa-Pro aminopeptidase
MEQNIYLLKARLQKENLVGFIIPSEDEFLSEYTGPHYNRLQWVSNFTGSAGTAVISSQSKSSFFTDGRYTLQAAKEVAKENFEIFQFSEKSIADWIKENFHEGASIGYDSRLFTEEKLDSLEEDLEGKYKLISYDYNFIDELWDDRPSKSTEPAFIYEEKYCGISYQEKLKLIRHKMNPNSDALIITMSESVCWLLNIRGKDLEDTPLLHSYAIICRDKAKIFTDINKITSEIHKQRPDIEFHNFLELKEILHNFNGKVVQIDAENSAKWFFDQLEYCYIIRELDPCIPLKAIKNSTEIHSIKNAHIYDGLAMVKFLYWLDNNINKTELTEISISEKLLEFRKEHKEFFSSSFATIAGFGANGAIVHYKAKPSTNLKIQDNNLLLLDSGAQYLSGTTDVTRTIPLGNITEEQKKDYTLVLKSHIMLGSSKFPRGIMGTHLDSLARYHLWQHQKDYNHGTGHGVGCFLGVHEGPARISKAFNYSKLEPGMVFSNEPGFYLEGKYGIRIENLVIIKTYSENFMEFETLTMIPINTKPIDLTLMTSQEVAWLNDYHAKVLSNLSPHITDKDLLQWLKEACQAI